MRSICGWTGPCRGMLFKVVHIYHDTHGLQHGLPPLTSFQTIDNLSQQEILAYFHGYNLTLPSGPNVDALSRDALKRAVAGRS